MPWLTLSKDANYEYIDFESLPSGMVLLDPSKLQQLSIKELWKHWTIRQNADSQGLVFLKAKPEDMHVDREAMPQHQKEGAGSDVLADTDNEEGSGQGPHPESPAAHAMSRPDKIMFLESLSSEMVYKKFVDHLISMEDVSILFGRHINHI